MVNICRSHSTLYLYFIALLCHVSIYHAIYPAMFSFEKLISLSDIYLRPLHLEKWPILSPTNGIPRIYIKLSNRQSWLLFIRHKQNKRITILARCYRKEKYWHSSDYFLETRYGNLPSSSWRKKFLFSLQVESFKKR